MRASILLPVRDAAATLALALRSVARQSEASFEVVLVDDGSRDGSLAIAEAFARDDRRVRVLATPPRGLVAALTSGVEAARAPVVVRMDGDDVMHRHRLRDQLALLDAAPELAAVGCQVRLFPRAGLSEGLASYERWLNAVVTADDVSREAFIECPLAHPTLAIRREVLARYGYRDMGWPEDYDLVLRLLGDGHRLASLPRRRLLWRDHPKRLSRTDAAYANAAFTACRAHHLARTFLARADRYVLWGFGDTGKALSRALAGEGKRFAAIVELHPGRLGQRIGGAPVIAPAALPTHRGDLPIVVSVAGSVPRTQIRAALAAMGYREPRDFVCCA
jgi:glycosyltransferase involved in cell wall biosynthesis